VKLKLYKTVGLKIIFENVGLLIVTISILIWHQMWIWTNFNMLRFYEYNNELWKEGKLIIKLAGDGNSRSLKLFVDNKMKWMNGNETDCHIHNTVTFPHCLNEKFAFVNININVWGTPITVTLIVNFNCLYCVYEILLHFL